MSMNKEFEKIPQEKFQFVQLDAHLHDKKLETKARSFFADAMLRFSKNKSSVVAAWILLFLLVFSFVSPLISPYDINDKDKLYVNCPSFVRGIADLGLGIMDGGRTHDSQNEASMNYWRGIAEETGHDPLIKIVDTITTQVKQKGKMVNRYTYTIECNKYFELGVVYRTLSYKQFEDLQKWQNETGIQVIFPYVEPASINNITDNPNLWYECDNKGSAILDKDGNFVPVYSTRKDIEGAPYDSLRIAGDDGSYIYSVSKSGAVQVRVCYYNYYQYMNGLEPTYIFGTTSMGQDLFSAIGIGARFSLIFAIIVSAINLSIGAVYGAIQGWIAQTAVSMPGDKLIEKLFPEDVEIRDKSVLSFTPALCASVQVSACVKLLTGRAVETGTVYYFDLLNQEFETIPMA